MNGDILTKVDYSSLLNYHTSECATATMAVREYTTKIPYGVVETCGDSINQIVEKPTETYLVNAGIYIIDSTVITEIEKNKYLDMPGLFSDLIDKKMKTIAYPIHEYWLDIGKIDDFEKAQIDYDQLWRES